MVGVAVGINGDPAARAKELVGHGVDVLVIDTAHGHQTRTLRAIESVRAELPNAKIVAGNVVTADGTRRADRGRRRRREGRRRSGCDVHDPDDDRGRTAPVLRRASSAPPRRSGSAGTSGPTAASGSRATSHWRSPAALRT